MNIFISYSTQDLHTVTQLAEELGRYGTVRYWDLSKVPGQESWPTIFEWIDSADLVFVVITDNTVHRAMSVGQEVGRAKYEAIDVWNPKPAIDAAAAVAASKKNSIEEAKQFAVVALAIGFFAWLFTRK